jgi:hypothetical protein
MGPDQFSYIFINHGSDSTFEEDHPFAVTVKQMEKTRAI